MQGNGMPQGMPQGFNMQPNPSNGPQQLPQAVQWTPETVAQMMQAQPALIPNMIKAWSEGRLNEQQANAVRQIIPILQAQRGQQSNNQPQPMQNMPQNQQLQNMPQSQLPPFESRSQADQVFRHWHTTCRLSEFRRARDASTATTYAKPARPARSKPACSS